MYFSENLETCTIRWVSFCEGGGAFFIFSVVERLTGQGWAAAVYPAGGNPSTPAHPERLHGTGSIAGRARTRAVRTRLDAGHAAPVCTRYQTGRIGQIVQAAGAGARGVSETVQIWTHSNMNDFQHKNVCKTVDTNTRTCYYIDNTRTCYITTKQEDKNHETDH